jgi:predicted transposase YdaD
MERGKEEGRQEGSLQTVKENLLEILQVRFEEVPTEYNQRLQNIDDVDFLKQLLRQAITVNSLEEFVDLLPYQEGS